MPTGAAVGTGIQHSPVQEEAQLAARVWHELEQREKVSHLSERNDVPLKRLLGSVQVGDKPFGRKFVANQGCRR